MVDALAVANYVGPEILIKFCSSSLKNYDKSINVHDSVFGPTQSSSTTISATNYRPRYLRSANYGLEHDSRCSLGTNDDVDSGN